MSVHPLYDGVRADLIAARDAGALDAAAAAEVLTCIGHGTRPIALPAQGGDALVRLGWLLFQRAPSLDGRYVALGPMNLAFFASGMRTVPEIVDELEKLELVSGADPAALEELLVLHGHALLNRVLSRSAGANLTDSRIRAEADAADARTADAAGQGRWEEVQLEGPDVEAVRTALRLMPTETAAAVWTCWSRSISAADDERWDEALAALDEAIRLAPDLFESWIRRAKIRFSMKDRVGAGADVEKAIHLNRAVTAPRAMRAELRTIIRDLPGALEDWDAAVQGAPNHMPYRLGRGYTRLAASRPDDAFADFSDAVRLAPTDKTPLFARAELRVRGRDLAGAADDYSRVLALDAEDLQALLNRGTVRLMARRSEEALADLTVVLERRPADPTAWARRGAAQIQLGHPWQGWLDGLTALALAPDDWSQSDQVEQIVQAAYQQLEKGAAHADDVTARAELVQRKAGGREVIRLADRLGRWLPAEAAVWHRLRGDLYLTYGRWTEATAAYRDALAVDAREPGALLGVGRALLGQGQHEAALKALNEARGVAWGLAPAGTFELHLALGRALGSAGRLNDALAAFDEALALRPDRGDVWFYRGVHASLAGDGEAAEVAYSASVERQSGFGPAWFNRACERARLGRLEDALDDLERACGLDPKWAVEARTDTFLEPLRGHPRFEALTTA